VAETPTETIKKFPVTLSIVTGIFVISGLVFSFLLKSSIAAFSPSLEGLLNCLPALVAFFAMASLAVIFSLVSEWQINIPGFLIVALLFGLSLAASSLPWKLGVGAILLIGLLLLRPQARKAHEEHLGFSAAHYRGVLRSFFFILIFALAMFLFLLSRQAVESRQTLIDREALEPVVGMVVEMFGGMLEQQFGADVPEEVLAPAVGEMAQQLLQQLGILATMDKPPTSLAEVTSWLTTVLENSLMEIVTPIKPYVPIAIAVLTALTLASLYPIIIPFGVLVFFIVYRLLILVRLLKLEEVPRTAKRLVLN